MPLALSRLGRILPCKKVYLLCRLNKKGVFIIKKIHKSCFTSFHCLTNDCPNIQYDFADSKYGFGIADDMGLEKINCSECIYNSYACDDCLFQGSNDCFMLRKERL